MSTEAAEPISTGMHAAVRLIADDASDRLLKAVRLPVRDDATEDSLRALLTSLHAAYPQVLQPTAAQG